MSYDSWSLTEQAILGITTLLTHVTPTTLRRRSRADTGIGWEMSTRGLVAPMEALPFDHGFDQLAELLTLQQSLLLQRGSLDPQDDLIDLLV